MLVDLIPEVPSELRIVPRGVLVVGITATVVVFATPASLICCHIVLRLLLGESLQIHARHVVVLVFEGNQQGTVRQVL